MPATRPRTGPGLAADVGAAALPRDRGAVPGPHCRTLRPITLTEFAAKWRGVTTGERVAGEPLVAGLLAINLERDPA